MQTRLITTEDEPLFAAFRDRVPADYLMFYKEDVSGEGIVARWAEQTGARRVIAVGAGQMLGYAAVIAGVGWSSHVGEIRIVVDPAAQRQGIGAALAREILQQALTMGLTKLTVEVIADQPATIALFQGLGFSAEALLVDHVRDPLGETYDLILLAHHVQDNWAALTRLGFDEALA